MKTVKTAIIGGSGLYSLEDLSITDKITLSTPFGKPSDAIALGNFKGREIAFLPRHGDGHRINPTNIPVKANIYALKTLGVERIISISAVGSLREEISPKDIVIPDQLIDRTYLRNSTFFTDGIVVHIAFAEPFCPVLSHILYEAASKTKSTIHNGGIYVAIEGPQFSTRAESQLYRSWGADIIGMTAIPEAKLAREAEICYSTLAMVTDYDCWHDTYESVNTEMIVSNLNNGVETIRQILGNAITMLPENRECLCATAVEKAIATVPRSISSKARQELDLFIGKYLK